MPTLLGRSWKVLNLMWSNFGVRCDVHLPLHSLSSDVEELERDILLGQTEKDGGKALGNLKKKRSLWLGETRIFVFRRWP